MSVHRTPNAKAPYLTLRYGAFPVEMQGVSWRRGFGPGHRFFAGRGGVHEGIGFGRFAFEDFGFPKVQEGDDFFEPLLVSFTLIFGAGFRENTCLEMTDSETQFLGDREGEDLIVMCLSVVQLPRRNGTVS